MSSPASVRRHRSAAQGALCSFLLLACCGGGGAGPTGPVTPVPKPPCGLSGSTQFPDDPKLVKNLGLFTPPESPSADVLDGHCRAVWQEVVEDRHCGQVSIPAFCETCSAEERPKCLEGNGRGLVMQRCRETSLASFTANYAACRDFALCAGKIQSKTAECKAGRQ